MAERLPDWARLRRRGEMRRFRWCLFYAVGLALVGFGANAPWLFGRWPTVMAFELAAVMFVVVGVRPGMKRRRTLVGCLALATTLRALGPVYPHFDASAFALRGSVYVMLTTSLTLLIAQYPIHEYTSERIDDDRRG